ncbi:type II toxin-antitoxin system VapC family toxin [Bifidobacterium sp. ESL0775]|uniref:type II toxin-antitoxin system VapC family toxin n=1 Tax=Bifidobacterium sp. ESL0775 TaxID=2983230 RepID=UPI0023F68C1A|nr:type II toxin-antitoxin system VapC family toxin [Bifidobacterium sp. ESL0775]WEV69630.1 type II toxin-antitoxin system VapC family toxin [Bifidobacterium sp. ESL0775]
MIILDTNVISELYKRKPNANVVNWIKQQPESSLRLSSITAAELLYGLGLMPNGKKKQDLARLISLTLLKYNGRISPFDSNAAIMYAEIAAQRKHAGHNVGICDTQIAGIAKSRETAIATRNVKDFADTGVEIINPWD